MKPNMVLCLFFAMSLVLILGPAAGVQPAAATVSARSVDGASGSYVAFDPSAGGESCYVPHRAQTFCFRAESFTTAGHVASGVIQRFPSDWTVSRSYLAGTPACTGGGTFATEYDTFALSPNEAGNYHLRFQAMVDNCVAHYCYEVVTGAGISDASVSWFWTGAMDSPPPAFPCSSDGYEPAGYFACDESITPPASVPVCTSPDPYLSVSPPHLSVEQCPGQVGAQPMQVCNLGAQPLTWSLSEGAETDWLSEDLAGGTLAMSECQPVSVTVDATELAPGTYWADLLLDSNDPGTPRETVQVKLVVNEPVRDVAFSWEPSNPYAGNRVVFRAAAQGVEPISYAWDFQGGTASSRAVVSQLYATPGEYLVTLTATNACGRESAQRTVTVVTGPVLELEPPALSPRQCGGAQTEQTLRVCNAGSVPLTWSLGEWPTFSAAADRQRSEQMALSPATRQAGEQIVLPTGSLQLPTLQLPAPPVPAASPLEAGSVLWDQPSDYTGASLSSSWPGLGPELYSADDFQNTMLWAIDTIFVAGVAGMTPLESATALHWCIYPDAGGVPAGYPGAGGETWCWSALPDDPAVTHSGGHLAGDVVLDVTAALGQPIFLSPGHWWLLVYLDWSTFPDGLWGVANATTTNLLKSQWIDPTDILEIGMTEWTSPLDAGIVAHWDLGFRLEGQSLAPGIAWLGEDPASGMVAPGACQDVTVTVDSAGLAVGEYQAQLLISSDDPALPLAFVPVDLAVTRSIRNAGFGWTPPDPAAETPVTFEATAEGGANVSFEWDFGDGESGTGAVASHTYAAPGDYRVWLTASDDTCGVAQAQYTVHVDAGPVLRVEPATLSAQVCPEGEAGHAVQVCNDGDRPLDWSVATAPDWVTWNPAGGALEPGDCQPVEADLASAGLAPGLYEDPLTLAWGTGGTSDVPVALTIVDPVRDADFSWQPASPRAGQDTTFTGTAQGHPIDYTWAFEAARSGPIQDRAAQGENPLTHRFGDPGDYVVSMWAWNACGTQLVERTVTVLEAQRYRIYLPIVTGAD